MVGVFQKMIPSLFSGDHARRPFLYVGAHNGRIQFGDELRKANYDITILEIFPPNVTFLQQEITWAKTVQGDVREETSFTDGQFDVALWSHGPEHILKTELVAAVTELERVSSGAVILACPWGLYDQGICYGNPHEQHISHYDGEEFEALGYSVSRTGIKDRRGSNVIAVKYL